MISSKRKSTQPSPDRQTPAGEKISPRRELVIDPAINAELQKVRSNAEGLSEEEKAEREFNLFMELALEEDACQKVTEGASGIILKLNLNELPQEIRDNLTRFIPELAYAEGDASAIKYLKIYSAGIHQEFEMQKDAHDLISQSPLSNKISVPKPYVARKQQLKSNTTISKLSSYGGKVSAGYSRICYELMDFIDGVDLETYLARQLVRQSEKEFLAVYPEGDIEQYIAGIDSYNLRDKLRLLWPQMPVDYETNFKDSRFLDFLQEKLKYQNVFSPDAYQSLSQAIELLHENGFYHRDFHLRNLMIDRAGKLYIIDFDKAKKIDPQDAEAVRTVYEEKKSHKRERRISDQLILEFLAPLSKTQAERAGAQQDVFENKLKLAEISRQVERIKSQQDTRLKKGWDNMIGGVSGTEPIKKVIYSFLSEIGTYGTWTDENYIYWMAVLLEAVKVRGKQEVINYCLETIADEKTSSYVLNKLNTLLEYLK